MSTAAVRGSHGDVRVTIDALDHEHNHDALTQYPDYSYLLVGAGADLATKNRSAPCDPLSWLRLIREYTQQQQQQQQYVDHGGGLGCLHKKYTT